MKEYKVLKGREEQYFSNSNYLEKALNDLKKEGYTIEFVSCPTESSFVIIYSQNN